MQCGEEPAFDLRQILELMSFVRPDVEGLLGEVASIGLTSGETEAEPVKKASSYRLLDAANSNTIEGFLQHGRRRSKKTAQSWRVSGGLSTLAHEPAQTT